jgi:hypothetical protein
MFNTLKDLRRKLKARKKTEPSNASAHVPAEQNVSEQDISKNSDPQTFGVGDLSLVQDIVEYGHIQIPALREQTITTGQAQLSHDPETKLEQEPISGPSMRLSVPQSFDYIENYAEYENKTNTEDEVEEASELSDTIDYSLIIRWLQYCEQNHGNDCSHRELEPDFSVEMDIIVIDVRRNCLARATTAARYLAVSYVWGAVPQLLNSTAMCESLMVPGALAFHKDSIPRVIIDAIDVVKNLEENYLWVDSLCIVQDDAEVKHHQIAHMAIIYSSAILTLVAVGARDANSNLPGVRPSTRWPREKQKPNEFNRPLRPDLVLKAIDRTVYVSRAWTFQERHLSRRCLYFLDEQIYFQCRMELWCEEKSFVQLSRFIPPASAEVGLNIMSRAPAWGQSIKRKDWDRGFAFYAELIQEYSWKTLSFPEDVLNAFSGLLNALETHSGWNFIHGLPEQLIDWALLWIPAGFHQRRPPPNSGPLLQFPSWSWIGWIGPITFNLSYTYTLTELSSLLANVELETFQGNTSNFIEIQRSIREKDGPDESHRSEGIEAKSFNLATLKKNDSLPGNILRFTAMTISTALFQTKNIPLWRWNAEIHSDRRATKLEQTGVSITSSTGLAGLFLGISLDFLRHYKWSHLRMVAISEVNTFHRKAELSIEPSETCRDQRSEVPPRPLPSADIPFWDAYRDWMHHGNRRGGPSSFLPNSLSNPDDLFYNIMLLQRRGPYYERVAVGQIDRHSWLEANPVKETILLV